MLSEDEDPFANNQETKDDHFFDCELPLDSDEDSRNLRNSS